MSNNPKKRTVIVLAFVCALSLMLGAVLLIHRNRTEEDPLLTVKPSVTISPDSPADSGDPLPPTQSLPYEGMTFRILCGVETSFDFGDTGTGETLISRMTYGRNLLICRKFGVTFAFDYTESVYQSYTDLLSAGKANYDLLSVNMLSDGSKFLMNGGLDNVSGSSLDLSSDAFDENFMDTFEYEGRCGFLLGEANPSRILSSNALFVSKNMTGADALVQSALSGEMTYDVLFEVIADAETSLKADENAFHIMLSGGGIFGFSQAGEAVADKMGYINRYTMLLPHIQSGTLSASEQESQTVFIDTLTSLENFGGYYVLPMPKYAQTNEYVATADMASLFAYAVPSALEYKEKTYDIIGSLYSDSVGFTAALASQLDISDPALLFGNIRYCFYDMFGWGDFSKHAWKSFSLAESADALSSRLAAPARAAEQALLILSERWKTHFDLRN